MNEDFFDNFSSVDWSTPDCSPTAQVPVTDSFTPPPPQIQENNNEKSNDGQ